MKAMFAHDHKFYRDEDGNYYSSGQFPYAIWQRYLAVFDELVVAGRVRTALPGERVEQLDLSSGPRVSFLEIPNLSGPVAMLAARREATRLLKNALQDCDALIARGSEIGHRAAAIAEELNLPWAAEVTSCPFNSLWNYGSWQGKLYAPIAAYMTRRLIWKAPYAIYVAREFLPRRYPCAGRVVSCSDVQISQSDEQVLEKRKDAIAQRRPPVKIGLIGSLTSKYKGIETAMQAVRLIQSRSAPVELHILGAGDPARWQQLATKLGVSAQTFFCGALPSGDPVNAWLDEIDLYIQPSFAEGLPRSLIEAMNRGCPALGSSAGGIPELLEAGCIHHPGDSRALASLLSNALEDKQWQFLQAERNFRHAASYDRKLLDQIRHEFWADFASYCQKGRMQRKLLAQTMCR